MIKIPFPLTKFESWFKKPPKSEDVSSQTGSVIGLDIGNTSLAVTQLSMSQGKVILEKAEHESFKPDIPISGQIKNLFATNNITETKVHVSMKGHGVILRFIAFPRMAKEEFQSAIQYEAEKYIPFSMSEVVLDFHIVDDLKQGSPPSKNMDVVLVAARKQEVMKLITTVQAAGLVPTAVDVDAIAFTNAFVYMNQEVRDKVLVLIDFGSRNTNINILERGILRFSRDISLGGVDITNFLMKKLGMIETDAYQIQTKKTWDDPNHEQTLKASFSAMIQEIKLSLNYFQSQHQDASVPSAIYVSGGGSQIDLLRKTLEEETSIKIFQWNPLEKIQLSPNLDTAKLKEQQPYLPVAIGLALRGKR